ncbi:MAG: hypothetical protein RIR38_648 [Actinomycetota bacterium]
MTAIPSRQRALLKRALFASLGASLLLPIGVVSGARSILGSSSGRNVDGSVVPLPNTPTALLASVNDANEITTLTALVLDQSGAGGTIVSMPVGAAVETLPSETPRRLADSFGIAGIEGVRLEAEGLLDATISVVGVAGPADFTNLLSVVPSLTVTFDAPVVNSTLAPPDPATTTTTIAPPLVQTDTELLPAGPLSLAPEQVVAALNARRIGDPESSRLPRVKAIWESLAAAVGTGLSYEQAGVSSPDGSTPPDIGVFLRRLLTGPIQVRQLTANPIAPEGTPPGLDLYGLDPVEIRVILASVAPSSLTIGADMMAAELVLSIDDATLAYEAVKRLEYVGIAVALIRLSDSDSLEDTTIIRHVDKAVIDNGRALIESVAGPFKSRTLKRPVDGTDAQITLGQSYLDFVAGNPNLPETTVPPSE